MRGQIARYPCSAFNVLYEYRMRIVRVLPEEFCVAQSQSGKSAQAIPTWVVRALLRLASIQAR